MRGELLVPLLLAGSALWAAVRGVDGYAAMLDGARAGLQLLVRIFPSMLLLLTGVAMLRSSGALELLEGVAAPVLERLGIPPETVGILLIRPLSGSGALGVGSELMTRYGPDSLIGRTAAVMLGSTETTFYTAAVYFGAVGIKKTRYAIPAALCADLAAFLAAAWAVRVLMGQ